MRIAFITSEYVTEPGFSGGLANYLGRLCPALAKRGHDVHVITRSSLDQSLDVDGVSVHRTAPLWHQRRLVDRSDRLVPKSLYGPHQDIKAAWAVRRKFCQLQKAANFDIVQLANVMAIGLFFRNESKTPVVLRLSSFKPDCMAANGGVNSLAERVRMITERISVRQQSNLYAPSAFVAKRVHDTYKCPMPTLLESPFYVEAKDEDPSLLNEVTGNKPFALFFGRLSRLKGVISIADALPVLFDELPDFQLVLAGGDSNTAPGNTNMSEYLRARAGCHADRVHILKPMHHDTLYPFVRAARLVAIPSLVDNLPNSALESMYFGKPVIATTGTSFEQLINHQSSGLLVPRNDTSELANSIMNIWNMRESERAQMGALARERIDQLHPDITIPRLLDHYRQVISSFSPLPRSAAPRLKVSETHST